MARARRRTTTWLKVAGVAALVYVGAKVLESKVGGSSTASTNRPTGRVY